jgi:anthranilate phosphoribosyltransferase
MTFGEQKHPFFVPETNLFSYLETKTPTFCFPKDFLLIQENIAPAKWEIGLSTVSACLLPLTVECRAATRGGRKQQT